MKNCDFFSRSCPKVSRYIYVMQCFNICQYQRMLPGIGSLPDAVLMQLTNHRELGIHTEMLSDGIVRLVHAGLITNSRKVVETGKIIGSFAFGTKELYSFMDNNTFIGLETNNNYYV